MQKICIALLLVIYWALPVAAAAAEPPVACQRKYKPGGSEETIRIDGRLDGSGLAGSRER